MTLTMTQLFVNRLTVIDCSFLSAQRGVVGESWQVDLELEGSLDEQGMVLDFGDIKKQVKNIIDDTFDHKLLVPKQYQGLTVSKRNGYTKLIFKLEDGHQILHESPDDAVQFVNGEQINVDALVPEIIETLKPHMPSNVSKIRLRLWPEEVDGAYYHYSHGLKHHCGNCQRIAHGHRSRIVIFRNDIRDRVLEDHWAELWRDIYIGTAEDEVECKAGADIAFKYTSAQGNFYLQLPRNRCYLIDTDSTVENIAAHIHSVIQAKSPQDDIRVYAYEGVDKGAIGA